MSDSRLRVGAGQFAGSADLSQNLAACERLIDQAAAADIDVFVLPEFANHISVYDDAAHCREVAVELDGPWLGAIAARAEQHGMHIAVTVTVPREADRTTVTSLLFGPAGELLVQADKQTLMGNERAHLSGGVDGSPLALTRWGPVGVYACMDGVTFETPRTFAVRGARLLLNGLNSFAVDEADLHIPVRAVENGVFVVAANKVGPLLPDAQVDEFSAALGIPADALNGAGESQVVAPDGTVLAQADRTSEMIIWADIDLADTDAVRARTARRRPAIYGALAEAATEVPRSPVESEVTVACAVTDDAARQAADGRARLVVLAEGVAVPDAIADGVWVVSSAVEGDRHIGRVTTSGGIVHEQLQLHAAPRLESVTALGDELHVLRTPWADLAVMVGDDHAYPEVARLAAIAGAHMLAVIWRPAHRWEADLALAERAAENRVCLAAASPMVGFDATMVLNPPRDSLWNPDRSAPYNGTINTPDRSVLGPGAELLVATAHVGRTLQREISRNTDLVGGRAWGASRVLVD